MKSQGLDAGWKPNRPLSYIPVMSKPTQPTREERRQAASSGTDDAPAAASAAGFILRLGGGPYIWLKREAPSVTWGPKDQAMRFRTKGEARLAAARLANHGALTIQEVDA